MFSRGLYIVVWDKCVCLIDVINVHKVNRDYFSIHSPMRQIDSLVVDYSIAKYWC